MSAQKIAFATEIDGETLSESFGTAPKAVVVTVEDGRETARETRDKPYHEHHEHHHHHEHEHSPEGVGANFAVVTDCNAIVTRRIGPPGRARAHALGLALYVVREKTLDEALQAYLEGSLVAQG